MSKTAKQLIEIELDKEKSLFSLKGMNLGFATEASLKELLNKDMITATQVTDFKEEARTFIVATLKKMIEKLPLASHFVRYAAIFAPTTFSLDSMRPGVLKRFKLLLKLFWIGTF